MRGGGIPTAIWLERRVPIDSSLEKANRGSLRRGTEYAERCKVKIIDLERKLGVTVKRKFRSENAWRQFRLPIPLHGTIFVKGRKFKLKQEKKSNGFSRKEGGKIFWFGGGDKWKGVCHWVGPAGS